MNSSSSEVSKAQTTKFYAEQIPAWTDDKQAKEWVDSDAFENAPPLDKARNLVALYALRHVHIYKTEPTELYKAGEARKAVDSALSLLCDDFGNNIRAAAKCVLFVMGKAKWSLQNGKGDRWPARWVFSSSKAADFRMHLAQKGEKLPACGEAFAIGEDSKRDRVDPLPGTRPGPMIVVRPGSLSQLVDRAMQLISDDPSLFVNSDRLVTIGDTGIVDVSIDMLLARLTGSARWVREVESGDKVSEADIDCPLGIAKAVYGAKHWPNAKKLIGIVDHPIMRPDGTILDIPGYDHATGYFYRPSPSLVVPEIPESPTFEQASDARERLIAPFCDFAYQDSRHVYVAIAAMMSVVGRASLGCSAVPGFFFDAPEKDSGKTHHLKAISLVATGLPMKLTILGRDSKEHSKLFTGWVKSGLRLICADNIDNGSTFGNGVVDSFFTAEGANARLLGTSNLTDSNWRGVVILSGNNVKIKSDTSRRLIMAQLLQLPPEKKNFKFDLLKHLLDNRGQYIADIFTILRYHASLGRPKHNKRGDFSSYEIWQSVIADAIVSSGGSDVVPFCVDKDDSKKDDDDQLAAAFAFVRAWTELIAPEIKSGKFDRGVTARKLAQRIWPQYSTAGTDREDIGTSYEGFERSETVAELADLLLEPTHLFDPRNGWTKGPTMLGRWLSNKVAKTTIRGKHVFREGHPGHDKIWRVVVTKNSKDLCVFNVVADGENPNLPTPLVLTHPEPKPKRGRSAPAVH